MAKINFNSAALYIDGKKVPGVTDIQFDGTDHYSSKNSIGIEWDGGYKKTDPNVYLDFEYNFLQNLVILTCKYQDKKSGYQLTAESLAQAYNTKDLLNQILEDLLSFLMVPTNAPIKLNQAYMDSGLSSKIKEWSMQFDTVSYNTQAITGSPPKETTSQLSKQLPGVDAIVTCPACTVQDSPPWEKKLWYVIQHLNDQHRWSRESIADWLDALPEEIDITFKTKELQ